MRPAWPPLFCAALDQQIPGWVDEESRSGRNESSCAVFGDDSGTSQSLAGMQTGPLIKRSCHRTPRKPDSSFLHFRGRVIPLRDQPGRFTLRLDSGPQSQSDEFHFPLRMAVAVAKMMLAMKFVHEVRRESNVQLEALSTVAKIGTPLEVKFAAPAFISKFSFRSLLQDRKLLADWRGGRFWAHALDHGPRIILDHIADQNAVGGKRARHHRNDDLGNAQRLREIAGVQTACPAERDQRKVSRIVTAFDGNHAQRPLH